MARKRPIRGVRQRVKTSRATYTKQNLKTGRTVYRKNGKFVSARSYRAAKASKGAEVEATELARAQDKGEARRPSTQWVIEDADTKHGRAGAFAKTIFPELKTGDPLTKAQRRELFKDMRLLHGFETFWHFRFPDLSREEAEERFQEMLDKLRKLKSKAARDDVREEFGLERYESI